MKSKLLILILLLAIIDFDNLCARNESIRIEDYSYKDGLTTACVHSAYMDSRGFMWICSINGLYRYDGYNFRKINTLINNFSIDDVYCITEDTDKNLWIGTLGNGIFHYNTTTDRITPVNLTIGNNIRVFQILFFRGKIWVATYDGLLVITPEKEYKENNILKSELFLPDPLHINSQVNKITSLFFFPGDEILWVGTNGSLNAFNTKTFTYELINTHPQNSVRFLSDYNNNLIAGSWDGGIFVIDTREHKIVIDNFINYVNKIVGVKRVMSVILDENKRLWLATYGSGLYIFNKNEDGSFSYYNYRNDKNQQESIKSDIINQMYRDNKGVVWLCMNQPALSKVYFHENNLNSYKLTKAGNDKGTKEISTVSQSSDKNKIWITTIGEGIYLYDCSSNTYLNFNNLNSSKLQLSQNEVSLCYQDGKGNLWIVYHQLGLHILPSKEVSKLFERNTSVHLKPIDANILLSSDSKLNSYITKFSEDSHGRIWIGAWGALYVLDLKQEFQSAKDSETLKLASEVNCIYITDRSEEVNYPISPVLSMFEESQNHYWLGTLDAGILELHETERNKFVGQQPEVNKRLPSKTIRSIYRDKKQVIWIGTNAGLCSWNQKTDVFKTLTEKNGLTSENINNIIEDTKSNIWISSSYGISRIISSDFSIENFLNSDIGNLDQYIPNAAILSDNGLICFSSNDAIITFNPDSIKINTISPPLYFTDIKINNRTVNPKEKYKGTIVIDSDINKCDIINVPYNHTLNIEFAALEYKYSQSIFYKYKIGNKSEWITLNSNQRNLILAGLKPGEYTLSVMLFNSNKGNNTRTIRLNYLPPFWQSNTAYTGYFVILLILFLTYRRLIIQKVLQKSVIEKERYEIKKLEELDKMKSEFFTNISHEFRTPLSLIINPLEKLVQEDGLTDHAKTKMNLILKSSNRLLKLTNELMDFSKIEKKLLKPEFQICEFVSLVKEVCHLFNNLADSMNIDYRLNSPFDRMNIVIDKGMIEKVIFNLLSNAFKYTPDHGVIMINLSNIHEADNEFIKLSVINTGEGISKVDIERIFDRYYQVNNVQNRITEGTGIGLSLVRSYIELHKGKVEVKSEPNLETCFEIYLPVHQPDFAEVRESEINRLNNDEKNTLNQTIADSTGKPTYHYQLLLIEDDEDIRNYIVDELSSDFKIITAIDGIQGLELANTIVPDLIITDVIMPGISGTELCITVKSQVTTSHIPILILSAKATVEQQIEGLEMGADVYMIKPFSIDHLKTQVVRLLRFKENIYARFLKENSLIPQGALNTRIDEEFFQKVLSFIEENLSNTELSVDQLANYVSLSKVQVYRKLKSISGQSVVEFIRTVRLKKAAQMVLEKRLNYFEIAYETGFSTPSYFTKCFHDHFGKTPSEFAEDYGIKT